MDLQLKPEAAEKPTPAAAAAPAPGKADAAGGGDAAAVQWESLDVQMKGGEAPPASADGIHEAAQEGVSGSGNKLPHLDKIQASFGRHDVSGVQAFSDDKARGATNKMGAEAYATGNSVAFNSSSPSLHTAAHEAAHVVQQQAGVSLKGGVGQQNDQYEQHADAAADKVVAGESAEGVLDQMAGGSAGGGGAVQAKAVQFEIKADLRQAMKGWGTDEAKIFAVLKNASGAELRSVLADKKLMKELRSELSKSDMERVLDALQAPLAQKLELAMDGWITDNSYIRKALNNASKEQLLAAGRNKGLVDRIIDEVGAPFLKTVLDKIGAPLQTKLDYAMSGWGCDDAYVTSAISKATVAEINALAGNAALLQRLVDEGIANVKVLVARRIIAAGGNADAAFTLMKGADDAATNANLAGYGSLAQQRTLLDRVILKTTNAVLGQEAFHLYWAVDITAAPAVGATPAANWPLATLVAIHRQMKLLPSQDTRLGVWKKLSLTNDPALIDRAAWDQTNGDLIVGANADPTSTIPGGYWVKLTKAARKGHRTLEVNEGARFKVGDSLGLGEGAARERVRIASVTGNTYRVKHKLKRDHGKDTMLQPMDGSGARDINWLDATVRHEIAHAIDGPVNTQPFKDLGGWNVKNGDDAGYDAWATAMGNPYQSAAGTPSDAEKAQIKAAIVDHVANQKGSVVAAFAGDAAHGITKYRDATVVRAAEQCLKLGDGFYNSPASLVAAGGNRFSVSWWYRNFMWHNESVVSERVANYGLYSPAEFFAEAYTVFYEDVGKGTAEEDEANLGKKIRNGTWRAWIKTNVHERGMAPVGPGGGGGGGATPGQEQDGEGGDEGLRVGGAGHGKSAHNPL